MRTSFDIETAPKPQEELEALIPEFDPESVKTGNYGKEAAAKKIEEARAAHREKFIKGAALDPIASTCKMVGFLCAERAVVYLQESDIDIVKMLREHSEKKEVTLRPFLSEQSMISNALSYLRVCAQESNQLLVGYNSNEWDLPYLIKRAWLNGICESLRSLRRGRYFKSNIVDLREEWGMGERFPSTGGLKGLAKMLKCPSQKEGDGMMFGDLYAKDPIAALDYLINDLRVTDECAERMGIV